MTEYAESIQQSLEAIRDAGDARTAGNSEVDAHLQVTVSPTGPAFFWNVQPKSADAGIRSVTASFVLTNQEGQVLQSLGGTSLRPLGKEIFHSGLSGNLSQPLGCFPKDTDFQFQVILAGRLRDDSMFFFEKGFEIGG